MLRTRTPFYEKFLVQNASRIPALPRRHLFRMIKPGQSASRRLAAAQALGVVGAAAGDAVPDLISVMETDPDIRWVTAQSLANIGGPAITALSQAATNRDVIVRHAAVYGLGQAGINALPATTVLLDSVRDANTAVQASALYSLRRVGPAGVPVVLEAFASDDPVRRETAVRAIKSMNTPPQQILQTLLRFTTNASPELREHSIQALQVLQLNNPRVIAAYVNGIDDPAPGVRAVSVRALNQTDAWVTNQVLGDITIRLLNRSGTLEDNVMVALNGLLEDSDPSVRAAAQQALASLQPSFKD